MGDSTHDDEEMLLAMNDEDDDGGGGDDGGGDDGGDYGGDDDSGDDGDDGGGDDDGGDDEGDEEEEDEGDDDGDDEEEEGDDEEEEDEDEEESDDEEDEEDEESDDEEDEEEEDDEEEASAGGDGGDDDGGDDDDGGGGDDDDDDGEDEDDDDDLEVVEDEEVYASEDDFPNATEEDFADDDGEWSDDDYEESAEHLFGDHEHFGETAEQQWADEGYELLDEAEEQQYLAPLAARAPAAAKSVRFVKSGGQLAAKGFVPIVVLQQMRKLYPKADFSGLHVTVPAKREKKGKIRKLPGKLNKIVSKKGVDLRKFATPVGDQKQTMRCSAFAWTHAVEMVARMKSKDYPRLSPSYTMLQFQKFQGDYQDFAWAAAGGEGTVGGLGPGEVLIKNGTCKGDLWPDDAQQPKVDENAMKKDAARFKLEAKLWEVKLEDLKKVLSAGYPVHLSMNTGEAFSKVGRDGRFSAAEAPSGDHGRHAMLLVGYTGNYYIVKNSWGTSWGDKGYCYIPKKVLAESEPRFVAIGVKK